jgi:flavin-dependent dehydrogenase
MLEAEVIIVGAGPAGSACAWKLNQNGTQTVLLDKKAFPRRKQCAGWITPGVLKNLEVKSGEYPHGILTFKRIFFHVRGRKLRVPTCQYSIRRIEFDHWLLK